MTFLPPNARTPIDSHTLGCWTFNESDVPYANSGAGGADPLTIISAASTNYSPAASGLVLPNALYIGPQPPGGDITFGTASGSGTDTVLEPAGPASVHGWVKLLDFNTSGFAYHIITKSYRPIASGWTAPYQTLDLELLAANFGTEVRAYITTAGGSGQLDIDCIPFGSWAHVALTYDLTTLRVYLNGVLAGSTTTGISGALDYGSHGPWFFGKNQANAVEGTFAGFVQDWRIEDVARSAAYFRALYRRGVGLVGV